MSSTPPPDAPQPGGFLSRLKGMVASIKPGATAEPAPEQVGAGPGGLPPAAPVIPLALPVQGPAGNVPTALPVAAPVSPSPTLPTPPADPPADPEAATGTPPLAPPALTCPVCDSPRAAGDVSCGDCGYYYSPADLAGPKAGAGAGAAGGATPAPAAPVVVLKERYELGTVVSDRQGVTRFKARDTKPADGVISGPGVSRPVVVVRQEVEAETTPVEPIATAAPVEGSDEEILPGFDEPPGGASPPTEILPVRPIWPSVAWERALLQALELPALPAQVEYFVEDGYEYLVLEQPQGQLLWDAWDDPDQTCHERFGLLVQVAELLHRLHQVNAIVEGLRPDIIVVAPDGQVRLADLTDLLPLPVPSDALVRGGLYTAPELLTGGSSADARADLYSFGAMLYALHVGRELNEKVDFDRPGHPKPFIPRFPDIHPAFGRLMMKTFRHEVDARFPTDEAGREDATGFLELIKTLETLRRTYDNVHLEIAAWTTTGIVRTGNEDAYALVHATESRQDDIGDAALILLCDGMGGYEAGEVAAALTLQLLRHNLLGQKAFAHLAGGTAFTTDPAGQMSRPEGGHLPPPVDVDQMKAALKAALKAANREVFTTSRAPGSKRRGMGCTAEAVYVDGRHVIAGHVGDSRVYHLHEGTLVQLTRDQTLVNRLVELGTLTPEEAATHPRRNELQQAIGGQPDVEPGVYHGRLKPGDWVVVCSDGVTNHVSDKDLATMLMTEAGSAEVAARRLVNLTNIEGATDNATVVVVRAT